MPIFLSQVQSVIQCEGDILTCAGTLGKGRWYLKFQESFKGEVGRDVDPGEFDNKKPLDQQEGVFILADNHRSIDIIIKAMQRMRELMVEDEKAGEQ